jgi:hypothetical protein
MDIRALNYHTTKSPEEVKHLRHFFLYINRAKDAHNILGFASEELRSEKDFMTKILTINPLAHPCIHDSLTKDEEFCKFVLERNIDFFPRVPEKLRFDKEIAIPIILKNPNMIEFTSQEIKSIKEIVMVCVKFNGILLKFASKELQNDYEVVMNSALNKYVSLQYASEELRNNEEIVLSALHHQDDCFQMLNEKFLNKNFILKAVQANGDCYTRIPLKFKNDIDITKLALGINGNLIQYSSSLFQDNKELVLIAIQSNPLSYINISNNLKLDEEILIKVLILAGESIVTKFPDSIRKDKSSSLKLVKVNGLALMHLHKDIRRDRDVILAAVNQNGIAIGHALKFKDDEEIIFNSLRSNKQSFKCLPRNIQTNFEIMRKGVQVNSGICAFFQENWMKSHDFALQLFNSNPSCLKYLKVEEFKENQEMIWKSKGYFKIIRSIPRDLSFHFE